MSTWIIILIIGFFSGRKQDNSQSAVRFLNALDEVQTQKALLGFGDQSRERWHYLPGATWPREGVRLLELNREQKELLFDLLRESLSETGYTKTRKILELEAILAEIENSPDYRHPGKYFVTFYGDPEVDNPWAWSFEGHHLSLNFTILDHRMSMAPRFMGANPATIPSGTRKGERTLEKEEDLAYLLMEELSPSQRSKAVFRESPFRDILSGNDSDTGPLEPSGIKMKELDAGQQSILSELILEYVSTIPEDLARKRMERLREEDFGEITFGWAGTTEPGKPHYYRVQGRSFLIELDNTQNGGNHIHSVWREFNGDFGRDLIREHYRTSDHHHSSDHHSSDHHSSDHHSSDHHSSDYHSSDHPHSSGHHDGH